NVGLTVDTRLAAELPRLDRNPFKLDLLNPAVQDTRRNEMMPYHSWAANSTELGGGTDKKNDLQVDGSPIGPCYKASYVPNSHAGNIPGNDADGPRAAGRLLEIAERQRRTADHIRPLHDHVGRCGKSPTHPVRGQPRAGIAVRCHRRTCDERAVFPEPRAG